MDPSIESHYRKAYFALVRELGLTDDERHELNRSMTGHESTGRFDEADWRDVVAELQRLNGQETRPGRPRLKLPRPQVEDDMEDAFGSEGLPATAATAAQVRMIGDLARQIDWRAANGLELLIRRRVLHEASDRTWHGELTTLDRGEASLTIRILQRMAHGKAANR